jgi:hypothetical protein
LQLAVAVAWVAAMTRTVLLSWGMLVIAAVAHAGNISITTQQNAHLDGSTLHVEITIGNTGDEAAHAVTPLVRFGDKEARGQRVDTLTPNASVKDMLTLDVGRLTEGTWAYMVGVDYTDANQYPFQAVQGGRLAVGSPPPAKISIASMKAGKLAKTTTLAVSMKNLEGLPRTVAIRLMPPDGIEASPATKDLTFEPWQEQSFDVTLTNRTALAGSRYPVFASAEYDAGGVHYSVLGQGIVEIVPSETLVDRFGGSLWIGAVGLGVLFVALVGLRSRRS